MESLTKKTITVSREFTYTYYHTPPAQSNGITVLCLHGFPDDATEWADLAASHLIPAGFGVLSVDCLGYAGTSKPTDPAQYSFELMTKDIIDILDHEKLDKVVSLGHDWGCTFAQRVYNYHPDRVLGLVMINVTYVPPLSEPFDLDAANRKAKEAFGYATFPYWYLFSSEDGYKLFDEHLDSAFAIMHGPPESWLDTLCNLEGLKSFLLEDKKQPLQPYVTEKMKDTFIKRFQRDSFQAPMCWYKAIVSGVQNGEAKKTPGFVVEVPSLYVGFNKDCVCRIEGIEPAIKGGLLPKLTKVTLDGGHWGLLGNAENFGKAIVDWLKKEFQIYER